MTARPPSNPFWGLVVVSAVLFCVSILAYIAAGFGQPEAPVNRFLMTYGAMIVAVEAGMTVALGIAALSLDRRQSRRSVEAGDKPVVDAETEKPPGG